MREVVVITTNNTVNTTKTSTNNIKLTKNTSNIF